MESKEEDNVQVVATMCKVIGYIGLTDEHYDSIAEMLIEDESNWEAIQILLALIKKWQLTGRTSK